MLKRSALFATILSFLIVASNAFRIVPAARPRFGLERVGKTRRSSALSYSTLVDVQDASNVVHGIDLPAAASLMTSVIALDPAEVLSDALGSVLNGPGILLIPIAAAVVVASAVAFLIVSYANPAAEDDADAQYYIDDDDDF